MEKVIITVYTDGKREGKEVYGEHIEIEGFEFLDLFISKYDNSIALGTKNIWEIKFLPSDVNGKYVVSELKTGRYLFSPYNSPEEAYYDVMKRLKAMGVDMVKIALSLNLQNYG